MNHSSIRKVIRQYLAGQSVERMRRPRGPVGAKAGMRLVARERTLARRAERLALEVA